MSALVDHRYLVDPFLQWNQPLGKEGKLIKKGNPGTMFRLSLERKADKLTLLKAWILQFFTEKKNYKG